MYKFFNPQKQFTFAEKLEEILELLGEEHSVFINQEPYVARGLYGTFFNANMSGYILGATNVYIDFLSTPEMNVIAFCDDVNDQLDAN